ncbi:MAG: hypothetical protein EZS28_009517 [Streblomastix strix]|uniref:Uncharacterized protein n=1 Tax=Streblomastix strix TaxID=222440 RepID=A0A5J4WKS7_9EUKA|nr:MAG: hypothetical protein EZS28_009517 [Streblomastix strix]
MIFVWNSKFCIEYFWRDQKKAAQLVASALYKVLSTISGPVGMIHPGIEGALGAGANLAGIMDHSINKR